MEKEQLKEFIESRGPYEVRSIRVFKNSFHVNYWHPEYKAIRIYGTSIESVPYPPNLSKFWNTLRREFNGS